MIAGEVIEEISKINF